MITQPSWLDILRSTFKETIESCVNSVVTLLPISMIKNVIYSKNMIR